MTPQEAQGQIEASLRRMAAEGATPSTGALLMALDLLDAARAENERLRASVGRLAEALNAIDLLAFDAPHVGSLLLPDDLRRILGAALANRDGQAALAELRALRALADASSARYAAIQGVIDADAYAGEDADGSWAERMNKANSVLSDADHAEEAALRALRAQQAKQQEGNENARS